MMKLPSKVQRLIPMDVLSRGRGCGLFCCAVGLALFLTACGDGNDDLSLQVGPPSEPSEQPLTGYLVDSAVAGVTYDTPTRSGVTGSEGDFRYLSGETVRFRIGDTLLGEVLGQEQVTPFDLAGTAVLTGTPDISAAAEYGAHPFHHVVGLVVLLQSLDEDADPGNGIAIGADVAALFEEVSLDLSEGAYDDPTLANIVRRANAEALFSVPHGTVKRAVALEHLYESMGVDANIRVPSRREWVNGEDPGDYAIETFEYGEFGYVTYEAAVDGDNPERVTRSRFDSRGNLLAQEVEPRDRCPPGVINWRYDNAGNITRIAWNWDYQGEDEFTEQWRYGSDGSAVQLTELDWGGEGVPSMVCGDHVGWVEIDFSSGSLDFIVTEVTYSSDGVPDAVERVEFDANGHPTREETDENADGVAESISSREYDTAGNLTRFEADKDGDGAPDYIEMHDYDANGNPTRYARDEDGDGTPELIEIREYDANGYWTRVGNDEDGDGTIDTVTQLAERHASGSVLRGEFYADGVLESVVVSAVDEAGRVLNSTSSYDSDGDGMFDRIYYLEFDYIETDDNGRIKRFEVDYNADGIPEEIQLNQYYADGREQREEEILDRDGDDGFGDGVPDEIEVNEYDEFGNNTLRELDDDGDGEVDEILRWEFDENGNLTRITGNDGIDGEPGELYLIETWRYDDHGSLILHQADRNDVGEWELEESWEYEYDANGYVIRKAWDEGDDGSIDLVESWQYDEYGNLLRSEVDEQENREFLNVTTVEYVPGSWGVFFPSVPLRDPRNEFEPPDFW